MARRGLHIDASSGMAGDMFMAALIDMGLELDDLVRGLDGLPLENFRIETSTVMRGALRATKAGVIIRTASGREEEEGRHRQHQTHDHGHHHGHSHHHHDEHGHSYAEIVGIIGRARFSDQTRDRALGIFNEIAVAEARVHGTTVDEVHFHEVGAVDSIVDVCAAAVGLEILAVDRVTCSAVGVGHGTRRMAHGRVPVPAPATAEIITGMPLRRTGVEDELLTPTGAAILKVLVDEFLPEDTVIVEATGYGAGSTDRADPPNVVRVQLFSEVGHERRGDVGSVAVLETQVDDCSGEIIGHARGLLEEAGALDVLVQPVQMKKNRPGFLLTVIAHPADAAKLEILLLSSTSTFGVRRHMCQRRELDRKVIPVETPVGTAGMKLGFLDNRVVRATPEYEDCARLAANSGLSLSEVMAMVEDAYRRLAGPAS